MALSVDQVAKEIALRRWVLPDCLHVPVAAVDTDAISRYVGEIEQVLAEGSPLKALLVRIPEPPAIDLALPIRDHPNCAVLHARQQVWVHVAYSGYRRAYRRAFPDEAIGDKVLSHCLNRRTAALRGFNYVRITPASRGANSSSGYSEGWGVELARSAQQRSAPHARPPYIQYGDLSALMLMLDIKIGGGVMAVVNEGQALVRLRPKIT